MDDLKLKINEAKNLMGDKAIDIIVTDLNIEMWDDKSKKGICPFHTKDGQSEQTPSFAWNSKDNAFKCFGCGKRYGILDHYQNMGKSFRQSIESLFVAVDMEVSFKTDVKKDYKYPKLETNLDKSKIYEYLNKRKISNETVDKCGVKQDSHGNIVFEYYDETDTLMLVKYRKSKKLVKTDIKAWCQEGADTSHILLNMNKVLFGSPLIITEGEIDMMSVVESGYNNVVSIPFGANNYHWIERNWDFLDNFDEFVICADNDEAGRKMIDEVVPRLGEWRCKVISFPENPNGTKCNDLNEILFYFGKDVLHEILSNAIEVPVKNIVDLATIPDIDLSQMLGIKSGIAELDKRISKFFLGTVSVWTGINGSGKSTLLNQVCVAEPTNQGFKSFIFSGELSPTQLRNWIEYPIAGGNNIKEIKIAEDQPTFFKVDDKVKESMREWYKGKIFLYDDEFDKSGQSLIKKMEMMARKYGVKNFLIDNLMSVDITTYRGDSIFEKQKEFVLDLIRFAIRLNVVIHLVAHPRKLDFVKRLNKMDVSGTGDITNLAHYVLAVHRVTPTEKEGVKNQKGDWVTPPIEFDAILDLFKNRPIGFQDIAIGLYFDRKSKRFYKTNDELHKNYNWDNRKVESKGGNPFDEE